MGRTSVDTARPQVADCTIVILDQNKSVVLQRGTALDKALSGTHQLFNFQVGYHGFSKEQRMCTDIP